MIYTYFEIREASDIRNVNKGSECVASDHCPVATLITIIDIFTLTANLCRPYKSLLTLTVNMITNNNKQRFSLELKMLPTMGGCYVLVIIPTNHLRIPELREMWPDDG